MSDSLEKLRVGEVLVTQGDLSEDQLKKALAQQQNSDLRLGELLVAEGIITAAILVQTLSKFLGVCGCTLRHGLLDPALLEMIGEEEAVRTRARAR